MMPPYTTFRFIFFYKSVIPSCRDYGVHEVIERICKLFPGGQSLKKYITEYKYPENYIDRRRVVVTFLIPDDYETAPDFDIFIYLIKFLHFDRITRHIRVSSMRLQIANGYESSDKMRMIEFQWNTKTSEDNLGAVVGRSVWKKYIPKFINRTMWTSRNALYESIFVRRTKTWREYKDTFIKQSTDTVSRVDLHDNHTDEDINPIVLANINYLSSKCIWNADDNEYPHDRIDCNRFYTKALYRFTLKGLR